MGFFEHLLIEFPLLGPIVGATIIVVWCYVVYKHFTE